MIRGKEMRAALAESTQRHAEKMHAREKALAKAVADVMSGDVDTVKDAAEARGVNVDAVRKAVRQARLLAGAMT